MNRFETLWAEIEREFDWNSVYKTMKLLDWTWAIVGGIPDIPNLKMYARELCETAYRKQTSVGTGGFMASYGEYTLTLEFTLASWEAS